MMMMPDRKKAVTLIISGMGEGEGPSPFSDDYSFAKKECAMKIMKCLDEKDVSGFCEYMEEFLEMCENKPSKPDMEDY